MQEQPVAKTALFYDDDCFPALDLNALQTLDFEMMPGDWPHLWSQSEPVLSDETDGLVILKLNPVL